MLALTLLDNCVKNCGYPFHLQIASKEFLNALVRRFPERPPARYAPNPQFLSNPVMDRILYLIKEWKVALSELSRYKDDMQHIKDMYRLLKFKGYQFPELRDSSVAALAPTETLKSALELEEEDRIAKAAKLQELIRRGRPQDLVEANKLMKIMTGYDQKHQTNFKEKFVEELHKIQNKARLLYEMLDNMKAGDRIDEEGSMEELKNACESALPKIRTMLKEEEDDEKSVTLKYQDIKNGHYDTVYDISGKFKSESNSFSDLPPQPISLIDLDDDELTPSPNKNPLDELSDIFGTDASISNASTPNASNISTPNTSSGIDPFDLLSQSISNNTLKSSPPYKFNTSTSPIMISSPNQNGDIDLVNKNGLVIRMDVYTVTPIYKVKAYYSNKSTAPMDKMTLLLAAPKGMNLKMSPISSDTVPPKSENTITQTIVINNSNKDLLRLRYKVTYEQFGVDMEQTGDYHDM
ncbi:uncharacterized protein EV154DRAFT_590246 [Mucor mucedo]|uniref:uncharacterized protein n=1 Tax=Mucor mucedo TaxID=29922 RepID=UPI00221FBCE9|nr:uncharacterized protein EV154DRAFT_590246 [Mucor mucedo]KAI7890558.1 hypothetical protein EV154DRAFT_590246 [Mucor mucedo]